jgi:hypothetical protein
MIALAGMMVGFAFGMMFTGIIEDYFNKQEKKDE